MGDKSKIQWTDASWNPVTGCTKVSPGCKHCYAETLAKRWGKDFTKIELHPDRLDLPLRWKRPRRVFVNSMSDLFHEEVPEMFVCKVFGTMAQAKQHTFQILTKRADTMCSFTRQLYENPLPNVWLGVSVENQETANERIPELRYTPAAVRFLSVEPILEPVNLYSLEGIHWVIVGGESGPGARPCCVEWIRDIVRQCQAARVPVFVKQLGSHPHMNFGDRNTCLGYGKCGRCATGDWRLSVMGQHKGADMGTWPADLCVREYPV